MKKKIVSIAITAAMLLAVYIPAMAADSGGASLTALPQTGVSFAYLLILLIGGLAAAVGVALLFTSRKRLDKGEGE